MFETCSIFQLVVFNKNTGGCVDDVIMRLKSVIEIQLIEDDLGSLFLGMCLFDCNNLIY